MAFRVSGPSTPLVRSYSLLSICGNLRLSADPFTVQSFQPLGNCFLVQSRAEAAVLSFFDF